MTIQKFRKVGDSVFAFPSQFSISQRDISEMYDRFDSGLCDQTTCNAVALAISQVMGEKVRVFRKNGRAVFEGASGSGTLPGAVYLWLEAVDRGCRVKPFRFSLNPDFFKAFQVVC
jgi:hypothetical protein